MKIKIRLSDLDDAGLVAYFILNKDFDALSAFEEVSKIRNLEDDENTLLAFAEGFWTGKHHMEEEVEYIVEEK